MSFHSATGFFSSINPAVETVFFVPAPDGVASYTFGGGDGFLCAGAGRCCVVHVPDLLLAYKHFRPIMRDHKSAYIFNQLGLFPVFEGEDAQRSLGRRGPAVVTFRR